MKIVFYSNNNLKSRQAGLFFSWFLTAVLIIPGMSCGKADLNEPIGVSDAAPKVVEVTDVQNISGGAIIKYNVPKDDNVNYVEAVYEIKGKETKKKGSFYTNELLLDGFPDSRVYKVSLYSVSFTEKKSEPVVISVNPATPPFQLVAQTLNVQPVFGGVKTTFKNPTRSNLQITFLEKNNQGRWSEVQTLYTSLDSGTFYLRGLQSRVYQFGVVCRDRWQNVSDTLTISSQPLHEELADVTKINSYPLPSDITYEFPLTARQPFHTGAGTGVGNVPCLWNGETHAPFSKTPFFFFQNITAGLPFSGLPSSITIDLGKRYTLSRFVYWPRASSGTAIQYNYIFGTTHVKTFELWASNNPASDGSYDSWTKIGFFESKRPSGNTTPGNDYNTEEDRRIAVTGESYDMPEDISAYRYIRYKVFSTWGAQPYWASTELQFYGNPQN
jgi:hypothetical protein